LLFADDLKMCLIVKSLEVRKYLQTDISVLQKRCFENYTDFRIQESNIISSFRKTNIANFNYHIGGVFIVRTEYVSDVQIIVKCISEL
jgi:hypothetical protein